jgi:polyhydroxyalkanoate synthase
VLLVPSLINRGYILDLSAKKSFVRWLAMNGLHPYLIDWGEPADTERGFTLTDYIAGRLERALDAILAHCPGKIGVVGYCMGGLLATALAVRRQKDISALVLMATPWDFHASDAERATALAAWHGLAGPLVDRWGELPVDAIQALFAALDPILVARKFMRFAELDPNSPQAEDFVALEDWLNDGVPLVAGAARECLIGWYGRNEPARGKWRVSGRLIEPAQLQIPALAVIPSTDRIVPPASATALANAIPKAEIRSPALGHIGMIVAGTAEAQLWSPLADWLRAHG